ncbi:hypothetical protein [Rhodoferax sp.]|uniref:hypothetical protein n=1 Tax=Rhodoferax sp. TaxID=50421 RepID=UPI002ACE84A6|nr:hypothetical protein [Rhodoferax sp.]MDZ7919589.1 hypothetical protein [Rhodoferax sp.]
MTMLFLGINILLIMGTWHFVVKKTLLDHTRDKLFDLRDEVRRVHLERGWSIDTDLYGNLRSMINAYLRYTENYSVWQVVALRVELSRQAQSGLREHLVTRINANFKAGTQDQQKYVADVRRRAGNALTDFAVYNSGLLLLLTILITPYFLVSTFVDQCQKGISAFGNVVVRDVLHMGRVFNFVWARSTRWVASNFVDQQTIDVALSNDSHRFA